MGADAVGSMPSASDIHFHLGSHSQTMQGHFGLVTLAAAKATRRGG